MLQLEREGGGQGHIFSTLSDHPAQHHTATVTSHVQCSTAARKQAAGVDGSSSSSVRPDCPTRLCRCDQHACQLVLAEQSLTKAPVCDQHGLCFTAPTGRPWLWRGLASASEHPPAAAVPTSSSGPASSSQPADAASSPSTSTSTASTSSSSSPDRPDGYRVMYQGFFARPHKRLKVRRQHAGGQAETCSLPLCPWTAKGSTFWTVDGVPGTAGRHRPQLSPEWLGATAHTNAFHWRLLPAARVFLTCASVSRSSAAGNKKHLFLCCVVCVCSPCSTPACSTRLPPLQQPHSS